MPSADLPRALPATVRFAETSEPVAHDSTLSGTPDPRTTQGAAYTLIWLAADLCQLWPHCGSRANNAVPRTGIDQRSAVWPARNRVKQVPEFAPDLRRISGAFAHLCGVTRDRRINHKRATTCDASTGNRQRSARSRSVLAQSFAGPRWSACGGVTAARYSPQRCATSPQDRAWDEHGRDSEKGHKWT